jgi:hypothetical protein
MRAMQTVAEYAAPILAAIIVASGAWYRRMNANSRSTRRTRQLQQAADMLAVHERALAEFLDDPGAPAGLKKLLIEVSDALSDREVVRRVSEWASSRPVNEPAALSEDAAAIEVELASLRRSHPDLAEKFDNCLLAGVAGACLRWPETAARFEVSFPNLAVTSRRDATIAATAAGFRLGIPFSLKPQALVDAQLQRA